MKTVPRYHPLWLKVWLASLLTAAVSLAFSSHGEERGNLQTNQTTPATKQSRLVEAEVPSDLVPSPVPYAVLLPATYDAGAEPLPLVLNLHGGGGNREVLARQKPIFDELWEAGTLPPMIIATPSATPRGFYMNYRDGSERWEDFLIGSFLAHLRQQYKATQDPKKTFIAGISMGGMGSLRTALKHPEMFAAVVGMEPGIEPVLRWEEMRKKHRFWRSDGLFEKAFGTPVDPDYWAANNPASIVAASADQIRQSGIQIYLEAGDEDQFWLYEGTEFLHQLLWKHKIKHEYHLVRGADHVGVSMRERTIEAYQFLARSLEPWPATSLKGARSGYLRYLESEKTNSTKRITIPTCPRRSEGVRARNLRTGPPIQPVRWPLATGTVLSR